jgi:uncharacterized protein (UPF0332 family)
MRQAQECIDDGKFLLSAGRGARTVINRAYYAAFYAVLSLLQTLGKSPRKHSGALALFDAEFVKTGLLPKELSMALHQLFETRQEDDYQKMDPIPQEEAAEAIAVAEKFVQAVRVYLIDRGYLDRG